MPYSCDRCLQLQRQIAIIEDEIREYSAALAKLPPQSPEWMRMQDHLLLAGVDLNSSRSLLDHHMRRAPEHNGSEAAAKSVPTIAPARECLA